MPGSPKKSSTHRAKGLAEKRREEAIRRANDELARRKIMCDFCYNCVPHWPADRWVRKDGALRPACGFHADEGENVPFDDGCREVVARKVLSE